MKNILLCTIVFTCFTLTAPAQVGINSDNSAPDPSAMLDVKSTVKGFLPPRMTFAERNAIVDPVEGLLVFCSNCNLDGTGVLSMYQGGKWLNLFGSCIVPASPLEGSHVQTNGQIIWNWNLAPIATGYKWSATNDYAGATNMGTVTTQTETGLTSGLSYIRYVWAYNACGNSDPAILTGQALGCGNSFTIAHTAGSVAPVSKTVTYGTVTNIPGETSKCWITRNLGATQQANTVSDNTEAAAGWYWQFNLKQGYKHDGTTRTPNTAWIFSISETSDWVNVNDPCNIELGNAWRIPTYTEWYNVDNTGGWTNWNGPWGSGLQLHAAGRLASTSGALGIRGSFGGYWSNTQDSSTLGWYLSLNSGSSNMGNITKTVGFSVRCLRDN